MYYIGIPNGIVRFIGLLLLAVFVASAPVATAATTLKISGTPASSVEVGHEWTFRPSVSGASGKTLHFMISHKPIWASFQATTGYVYGKPAAKYVGTDQGVVISVSDGTSKVSLRPFNIAILEPPPTISGTPSTTAVTGRAYAFTPAAKATPGSVLSFSIANKPSWASFSIATGELSGTPTTANERTFSDIIVSVSNGSAKASLPAFNIVVSRASAAPTIAGIPAKSIAVGQPYAFQPTATVPPDTKATFSIAHKPIWASFSAATGALSGKPTMANVGTDSDIVISVSDGASKATLPAFAINVTEIGSKSVTLSWKAPTENTNGSALTNLAGYRIFYGASPSSLTQAITIASVGITTDVVSNLSSGTYYFEIVAYTSAGVESKPSTLVKTTL
jgi:hypothetical protein